MIKNERAQNLAYDWMKWLRTRSFYGQPPPKHILAILSMPDTGGEPPDAKNSADIAAFHLGVCSLPDHLGRPFIKVYCGYPEGKTYVLAKEMGMIERTFYKRAHQGASEALLEMGRAINRLQYGWSHPVINPALVGQSKGGQETGVI